MAVKLTQIKGDLRKATVSFGEDGDLNVVYRRGVLTPAREEEMVSDPSVRSTVQLVVEMLVEWDLLDDDGIPLPFDVEVLMRTIPSDVFVKILEAFKAESPGEANGAT